MRAPNFPGMLLAFGWWALVFWLSGRTLLAHLAVPAAARRREWRLLAGVALAAGWALSPFFYTGMIGAGDSYHYTLQLADFVTQLRRGILPVLVGQTEYAFNGNVHTVRTAPYFTAFGGLVDLLTLHQLTFFALKNVLVLCTGWAAAFSTYAVARALAPGRRVTALVLAYLYVGSPALLGPLIALDLDATFLTSPWLPLFGLALVRLLERRDDPRALLLAVGSLAVIWYAHAPTAAWISPAFGAVLLVRLLVSGGRPRFWAETLPALGFFAALTCYLFYSVASLRLPYTLGNPDEVRKTIISGLKAASGYVLAAPTREAPASDLQLGWALDLVLLVACWPRRPLRAAAGFLSAGGLLLLVFLFPLWDLTAAAWSLVPARLLDVTNVWPAQRFYPLLAMIAVMLAAMKLATGAATGKKSRAGLAVFTALLLLLGTAQLLALQSRARQLRVKPGESEDLLRPENVTLTRSSYLLFNHQPDNYSDGWVDPQFASRLLDEELNVRVTPEAAALDLLQPALAAAPWQELAPTVRLPLDRARSWLFVFRFTGPPAPGEISLRGAAMRAYTLPLGGFPKSFGSAPGAARTLTVRADPGGESLLELHATIPGVAFQAVPYAPHALPIDVLGLTPYHARVNSRAGGFLETPQVWVPGYAATVNGRATAVRRSLDGLVTVPIGPGAADIVVTYPGPPGLRGCWWLALGTFLSTAFIWRRLPRSDGTSLWKRECLRADNLLGPLRRLGTRRGLLVLAGVILLAGATVAALRASAARHARRNTLRIELELPRFTGRRSEPLVVTGRTGRADSIYLIYEDATHVRLGFDHWGAGGPVSAELPATRGGSHVFEVTLGSLDPRNPDGPGPLRVRYDGATVMAATETFWAASPEQIYVGENPVGLSSAEARFSGRLLSSTRIELPAEPPAGSP